LADVHQWDGEELPKVPELPKMNLPLIHGKPGQVNAEGAD